MSTLCIGLVSLTLAAHTAFIVSAHNRSLLFTVLRAMEPGQYEEASRMLDLRAETVRQHAMMSLDDILLKDDLKGEHLSIRGMERLSGILAKTSVQNIEAAVSYMRKEAVVSPNKGDLCTNPDDPSDKKQRRNLFGLLYKHHQKFLKRKKAQQQAMWECDRADGAPDVYAAGGGMLMRDLYACSTLLHRASDPAFVIVSVKNKSAGMQTYDPAKHRILQVAEKRVFAKNNKKKSAFQASLRAVDEDPDYVFHDVCSVKTGDDVVEVYLHEWENRKKGRFENIWKATATESFVVPARLIRAALPARSKVKGGDNKVAEKSIVASKMINRGTMRDIYEKCKVFHMSLGIFCACRPFDVKFGTREACACTYHLRGEYMSLGLKQHVNFLYDENQITEEQHTRLMITLDTPADFLNSIVCPRAEGQKYASAECICNFVGGGVACGKCKGYALLKKSFEGTEGVLSAALEKLTPRPPDLRNEDAEWLVESDGDDAHSERRAGRVVYMRQVKTLQQRKDRTTNTQKEFVQRSVTLDDFWSDFLGFYPVYIQHHEVAKSQANEFEALKSWAADTLLPVLRKRHFRIVIDFLQRHALKRGLKETQQEFFAQLGITINVVSLSMHVSDAKNLEDGEKERLLAFFDNLKRPAIIRESHVYMSHDPERGQAMVQHILNDIRDYNTGDGKYAEDKASCSKARRKMWVQDEYYNGRAAGDGDTFDYGHANSDGCNADFKCASFLLYLASSSVGSWNYVWDWFCSCHGKTEECDGDGGTYKTWMDGRQLSSETIFNSVSSVVRDSRQHRATPVIDFYKAGTGDGIYRFWYHEMPMRGVGSIQRNFPHAAEGKNLTVCKEGHSGYNEQFQIGNMHRAVTQGWPRTLHCATRSCFSCRQCDGTSGDDNYMKCETSKADADAGLPYQKGQCSHELVEVQVHAKTEVKDAYTRGKLVENAAAIFDSAQHGDILAVETQSNSEPFWLVRVAKKHKRLKDVKTIDAAGVKLRCERGSDAVEVTKMMISSPLATNTFCDDLQVQRLFIPKDLIRVGNLEKVMTRKAASADTTKKRKRTSRQPARKQKSRTRAAVHADGEGKLPEEYFELKQKDRRNVVLKCRAADHEAEAEAEAEGNMTATAAAAGARSGVM